MMMGVHKKHEHESGYFEDNILPELNNNNSGGHMPRETRPKGGSSSSLGGSESAPLISMMRPLRTVQAPSSTSTASCSSSSSSFTHRTANNKAALDNTEFNKPLLEGLKREDSNNNSVVNEEETSSMVGRKEHSAVVENVVNDKRMMIKNELDSDSSDDKRIVIDSDEDSENEDKGGKGDNSSHPHAKLHHHGHVVSDGMAAASAKEETERSESVIFTGVYKKDDLELEEASRIRTHGKLWPQLLLSTRMRSNEKVKDTPNFVTGLCCCSLILSSSRLFEIAGSESFRGAILKLDLEFGSRDFCRINVSKI